MNSGVTVALVIFNERENISRALASLDAPPMPWEILVIDNGSTDGTQDAVKKFQQSNPSLPLRLLDHAPNNLGASRAFAVREARYSAIGFIDADCVAPANWIGKSFRALLAKEGDPKVLGVGSGNFPPAKEDLFNQALGIQLTSSLGHMNTPQARTFREARELEHLPTCNVFYFRDRLQQIGNFSSRFDQVCEDLELSLRAKSAGFKFIYQPGLEVTHIQKPSFLGWGAKMFRYGWGQIEVARLHPSHMYGTKALPLVAAIFALLWAAIHPVSLVFFFLFYLAVTGIYSTAIAFRSRKPHLSAHVFLIFVTTHFFYSAGELWGIFRQVKNWKVNERKGKQARLRS